MKNYIAILVFSYILISCEKRECCVFSSELAEFHGEWKLERITNGFAQQDQIGSDEIGYKEYLKIDAIEKTFIRQIDKLPEEKSRLQKGNQGEMDALILTDEKMYHWYFFETWQNKEYLVLYQKSYLDAILADGSSYYYLKQ